MLKFLQCNGICTGTKPLETDFRFGPGLYTNKCMKFLSYYVSWYSWGNSMCNSCPMIMCISCGLNVWRSAKQMSIKAKMSLETLRCRWKLLQLSVTFSALSCPGEEHPVPLCEGGRQRPQVIQLRGRRRGGELVMSPLHHRHQHHHHNNNSNPQTHHRAEQRSQRRPALPCAGLLSRDPQETTFRPERNLELKSEHQGQQTPSGLQGLPLWGEWRRHRNGWESDRSHYAGVEKNSASLHCNAKKKLLSVMLRPSHPLSTRASPAPSSTKQQRDQSLLFQTRHMFRRE